MPEQEVTLEPYELGYKRPLMKGFKTFNNGFYTCGFDSDPS